MQTKIKKIDDGYAVLLPKELLEACDIRGEATVIVQNRTLIVAAAGWRPRQGWDEALQNLDVAAPIEDQETLAYWAGLPETAKPAKSDLETLSEATLREQPKPYGNPQSQGGA